jgi:hypothetical protein
MYRVLCREEFEHWTLVLRSEDCHSHAQRANNRSVRTVACIRFVEFVRTRPKSFTYMFRTCLHMFRTRPEALADFNLVTLKY